ncbi:hypothetical protein BDR26DRAFT_941048 [Obelidium mucronatum]|nr:hypothetical protein BDR26DRAFT_941048 [Obelidium mucronatum]
MVQTTPTLQLESLTFLAKRVALSWASDINGTGVRIFGSLSKSESVVERGQLVMEGLWTESNSGTIDVVTLQSGLSLVAINGLPAPDRIATLSVAITELLKAQNVSQVFLVSALNVSQSGSVLYAGINTSDVPTPLLNTSLPLNDRFLGALVPCLHCCPSISTTLICSPAKKERQPENARLLHGMNPNSVDECIGPLAAAAESALRVKFDSRLAASLILPHIAAVREREDKNLVDKKDDLLLMYM